MFGVSHESASGRSWSGASQTRSSRWRFSCNQEVVSKCAVGCGPNLIRSARVRPAGCCRANQVRVFRLLDALGLSNLVRAAVFWPADADRANQVRAFRRGELPILTRLPDSLGSRMSCAAVFWPADAEGA